MKIGSRLRPAILIGSCVLPSIIGVAYWVPILWWLMRYLLRQPTSLPGDLPFWTLMGRTLFVSAVAALAAVLGAYPLVLIWRISGAMTRQITVFLMVIPMIMGLLARNYSWIGMLSSNKVFPSMGWSLLNGSELIYTRLSVYIVMSCVFVPIAYFILIQGASSVTKIHIDAARTLGVPDWKILAVVLIPLTARAATLAFGLILAMSVGFFITPRMIGGGKVDFVSNAILTYVNFGQFGYASVLALYFLAIMFFPVSVTVVYALRRRRMVTGR
jgi:putative spermidine/putrescine transport system permease protein